MTERRRLALWTALVVAATVALHAAGQGALATPPLSSPTRWRAWLTAHDPVVVACALSRLAALAGAWYLLAVTAAHLALRAFPGPERLAAVVDRFTVPPVRRFLAATVTVSLITAGLSALPPGPASRPAAAQADSPADPQPPPTVTMHRLPDPDPATGSTPDRPPAASWSVEPGECFWSIAEAVLVRAGGRPPSNQEVVRYWLRLIEANRATLADPANPDLVFPGQVFTIPPPGDGTPALAATA